MCTMVTWKNLYVSAFIWCCYGYQTGDTNSNFVILDSSVSFCDIKMFIQPTLFSSFLTIKICQFLKITLLRGKKSAYGKPARSRSRMLTNSARKRNREEVLANYNKTRINIGHQHGRWVGLEEALRVQSLAEV